MRRKAIEREREGEIKSDLKKRVLFEEAGAWTANFVIFLFVSFFYLFNL